VAKDTLALRAKFASDEQQGDIPLDFQFNGVAIAFWLLQNLHADL
jgi:hypothetical protein